MLSRARIPLLRVGLAACAFALIVTAIVTARPASAQVEMPRDYDAAPSPVEPVSATTRARASESPPGATPATEQYWYGWQTAASDVGSLTVMLVGASTHATAVTWIGVGGVFLGAPAVHFANERGATALASLGLRVALGSFGAFLGYTAASSCHDDPGSRSLLGSCVLHGINEAAIGALVGLGSVMIVDAAFLAHGTRETEAPAMPRESGAPHVTSIAPSFDPLTRTAAVGVGGRF